MGRACQRPGSPVLLPGIDAVAGGGGAEALLEDGAHVFLVLEAGFGGDQRERQLGVAQQFLGAGQARLHDLVVDRAAEGILEAPLQDGAADISLPNDVGDVDAGAGVFADEPRGIRYYAIFDRQRAGRKARDDMAGRQIDGRLRRGSPCISRSSK